MAEVWLARDAPFGVKVGEVEFVGKWENQICLASDLMRWDDQQLLAMLFTGIQSLRFGSRCFEEANYNRVMSLTRQGQCCLPPCVAVVSTSALR